MSMLLDLDAGEVLECLGDDVYVDSWGNRWILVSDNRISHEVWNEAHEIMFVPDDFSMERYLNFDVNGADIYENYVRKALPYSDICRIFCFSPSDFTEEDYTCFIEMEIGEQSIADVEYDRFLSICREWNIRTDMDEEQFKEAKSQIVSLRLLDFKGYQKAYYCNTLD